MKVKLNDFNLTTINKLEELYDRVMSERYDKYPKFRDIISLFADLNDEKTARGLNKVNLISWLIICCRPDCSEDIIEKYIDIVDWEYISFYFKMSPEFVSKYIDKITEDIFDNPCFEKFPDSLKLLLEQNLNV